jgi:hypothetical protein
MLLLFFINLVELKKLIRMNSIAPFFMGGSEYVFYLLVLSSSFFMMIFLCNLEVLSFLFFTFSHVVKRSYVSEI